MTRREQLLEAYEDAYFALLMDAVAQAEGEKWEQINKELQEDPAAAVPDAVDRRCLRTIDRYFARQRQKSTLKATGKVLNRVAVIMAIVGMLFTTALAISEDMRVTVANLLITVNERYTELRMEPGVEENRKMEYDSNNTTARYFDKIHIGWLPEGFYYVTGEFGIMADFENEDGLWIAIDCYPGDSNLQLDTEDADEVEYIEINGVRGIQVLKEGRINILLMNEQKNLFVNIFTAQGIASEITWKIAENILFY